MSSNSITSGNDFQVKLATQDILKRSSAQPIYLSNVEVVGGETFSSEFFNKLLSPLTRSSDFTLKQLLEGIDNSYNRISRTEVFKSIDVGLYSDFASTLPAGIKNFNKEDPIKTKVVFKLVPVNLNSGDVVININNEENLNVKLNYLNNNFNENAEALNFGVSYNPYKPNEHLIANAKFLANFKNPSFKFVVDLFNTHQNNKDWQQASERSSGGLLGLQYKRSSLTYLTGLSISKRTIHDVDPAASDDVKVFAGDYLKSSFINNLTYSNLKYLNSATKNFAVSGYDFALSSEISSSQEHGNPSSKDSFSKGALSVNTFTSLFNNALTLRLLGELGSIYKPEPEIPLPASDKFYLGGYNSFKGFKKNSVDTAGGLQFYKLGGTLYSRLPFIIHRPNKPQVTASEGEPNPLRLYATGLVGSVGDNLFEKDSAVSTVGFGLAYLGSWANLDVGYFVAKRLSSSTDLGIKDGLQFSMSIAGSNRTL